MIFAVLIFKDNRRNCLYMISVIELMTIPFVSYGLYDDFCTRCSIPALFMLQIFCLKNILRGKRTLTRKILIILTFVSLYLSASKLITIVDLSVSSDFENIHDSYKTLSDISGNPDYDVDMAYNYYTFNYDRSLFRYFAKNNSGC